MKTNRQVVYEKYNGHCAYCGDEIEIEKMHDEHKFPKHLSKNHNMEPGQDNNRIENRMPSCRACNWHKGGMQIEEWRSELQRQVSMLKKNAQFKRALRFKQIRIEEKPIVFYYEFFKK